MGHIRQGCKGFRKRGAVCRGKRSIAKLAAALIGQEDFVYIDAGTSTASLAEAISEREAVYVTNGILHAKCLAEKGCRVFCREAS